jgi:signal transduction histidine kinase
MVAAKDEIVFTIADDGVGMDNDTCKQIFNLFYSTKESKGTGLGLFITQRIVSQHGGSLAVTSRPGEGARFKVSIPRNGNVSEDVGT